MDSLARIVMTNKFMSATSNSRVCVTGGGAYKYKELLENTLHIDVFLSLCD
jgi:pantothenate kinase